MQKPEKQKILYINNIRILLTTLIVSLHIAITYGAEGSWYYHEYTDDLFTQILLTIFVAVIQSFSLGFYFLISGYFTVSSYDRKGAKLFLKDRFLRLGIPLLIYFFIISPLSFSIFYNKLLGRKLPFYNFFNTGPLWFTQLLLIFDIIYVFWMKKEKKHKNHDSHEGLRRNNLDNYHAGFLSEFKAQLPVHSGISYAPEVATQKSGKKTSENYPSYFFAAPEHKTIFLYILFLSLANFIIRIWFPIGKNFSNLQFAFFPGYISLFIFGIIASKNNWFDQFPDSIGKFWFKISITLIFLFPIIMLLFEAHKNVSPFMGGFTWQSLVYSTWETIEGIGIISGLFTIFRKKLNYQNKTQKILSDNAYTVYIIHAPLIVYLSYFVKNITLHPLIKFILISLIGIPFCFFVSHFAIRKIPNAKKIL